MTLTFRPVCSVRPHLDPLMALDLSPNGLSVVTGGGDEKLAKTSIKTNCTATDISSSKSQSMGPQNRLSSPSSSWAKPESTPEITSAVEEEDSGRDESVDMEDQDHLRLPSKGTANALCNIARLLCLSSLLFTVEGTSSIRHRSDGRIVVTGHWDNSFRIYDTKRMKPLAVVR